LAQHLFATNTKQRSTNTETMSKVNITLLRSPIDKPKRQKLTLTALGFRKMNQTIQHEATPQIEGMLRVVAHLVKVENV
jgi:large subunit ribosomal protein L30